ncbi:MAG: CheR family methyltransferase [Limnoraphis sp.]
MSNPNPSDQQENFYIVAIGASAGGIQALQAFFANLPQNPNAAFIVILHQPPDTGHRLAEILQRQTSLPVNVIENESAIDKNNIYVQPPHTYLNIRDHCLYLTDFPTEGVRHPITHFFQSLAVEYNERVIAIVLSGSGSDGSEGLKNVSRAGGIALVQCPDSAQFQGMPTSAIPSGLVDEILSPVELAEVVYDIIHLGGERIYSQAPNIVTTEQLGLILNILTKKQQTDFSQYKTTTLNRRIGHRFALSRMGTIESYIRFLGKNNEEQQKLCQDILIGATRFFRDPQAWKIIANEVLPELINKLTAEDQLRVWVSACATGEEAYTIAILVDEAIRNSEKAINYKIFATDLDDQALETASNGIYPEAIANDISTERLERYFTYHNGCFRVKRSLREMLIFAPHDLTNNPGFSRMSLVTCRNVLIYMQPQLQQRVLQLLHFSLKPQGVLFLGDTESLGELSGEFAVINPQWKIFSKRRDIKLSLTQSVTRQPAIVRTSMSSILPNPSNLPQFELLLADIFKQSFESRLISCVLVNRDNRLINVFYNSAELLEIRLGEADLDITKIIHSDLKLPLATSLHRAKRNKEPVMYNGIKISRNNQSETVRLKIGYQPDIDNLEDYFIVLLEVENPENQPPVSVQSTRYEIESEAAQRIVALENELQQTRENLQAVVEELETFNEEQQATNEELLASNEELQSTNEELQSANEELYTVNAEYQLKIEQLTQLTDDEDNLLRSTNLGVLFLDLNLNIRRFTPAATQAINIRPSDVNRSLFDFTNNLDCPNLLEVLRQVLATEEAQEKEVTLSTTGEQLLMRMNCYLREENSCDGIVITFVNINQIKKVQQRLENTNNLLENLNLSSPVGLFIVDSNLQFLRVNPRLAEMNNRSVEDYLGKRLSEVIPQLADEQLMPVYQHVLGTGEPVRNIEVQGRESTDPQTQSYWLVTYYSVEWDHGEQAIGGIIVDITARKQAELALDQLNQSLEERVRHRTQELEEAKQKAETANNAKSQFLSRVTHELRSPLNIILGFTQLLERCDNLDSQQQQQVNLIFNNGQQLLKLINELLDLGKVEANRMELNVEWFDLYCLMDELQEMFKLEIQRKGLEFRVNLDSQVPQQIQTDKTKLRQVLINLITNAIKFTDVGQICLRVNVDSTLSNQNEDQSLKLRFEVEDTGRGIPPEELDRLFEPFVQGKSGRNSQQGTGLGLAICRYFVEMMGGEIGVNSTLGAGTRIHFSIVSNSPVKRSATLPQLRQEIIGLAADEPQYTILVVDDRADSRQLLILILESVGFEIIEATNGLEAITQFEQHEPQLILMDIRMPILNGLEAIEQIKATPKGEGTVMIAILTSALDDSQQERLNRCCDEIIFKPIKEDVILDKIAECLGVRYVYRSLESTEFEADYGEERDDNALLEELDQMSNEWRSQLYEAALTCNLYRILQLLEEIPEEQVQLKQVLSKLALDDQFHGITQFINSDYSET